MRRLRLLIPLLFAAACQNGTVEQPISSPRCLTIEHLDELLSHPVPDVHPGKADTPLELRDAFGTFNTKTSAHFAMKWGPDMAISDADVERLLGIFEQVWQMEIVEMTHPAPVGTDRYFYNVYIANTGGGAPTIPFEGGYSYIDAENFPFFVMHPKYLGGAAVDSTALVAHEFYHSVQFATRAFGSYEDAAWYWESTAVWIAERIAPHSIASTQMGVYGLQPELSVDHYEHPGAGSLAESHHYAAAIFEQFLTEKVAGWELIRDSWTTATPTDTPLAKLETLLAPHHTTIDEAFRGFAGHTAAWDYADGPSYVAGETAGAKVYAKEEHRIALELDLASAATAADFIGPPTDRLPQALGYDVVRLKNAVAGSPPILLELRAQPAGDQGTPSLFSATLVRQFADHTDYIAVPFVGADARLELADLGGEKQLSLVVSAIPPARVPDERFAYTVRAAAVAVTQPPVEHSGGCDQSPGAPTPRVSFALVALALLWRRARRATRRSAASA